MSITTTPAIRGRKPLSATVARGLAAFIAAAWRSRTVPQDGEHPLWCSRPAAGCTGSHERGYDHGTGYENGSIWFLSASLPIEADEDEAPRIVGSLVQREADRFHRDKGERLDTGSLVARLELSVEDARLFAYDLLKTAHALEAGVPRKRQDQQAS